MTNGITMKGKWIIIPYILQSKILEQLHSNHMGIQKIKIPRVTVSVLAHMNADMKNTVKQYSTCLDYQQMQPQENITFWNPMQTMQGGGCHHIYG